MEKFKCETSVRTETHHYVKGRITAIPDNGQTHARHIKQKGSRRKYLQKSYTLCGDVQQRVH